MKRIIYFLIFAMMISTAFAAYPSTDIHEWYMNYFSPTNILTRDYSPEINVVMSDIQLNFSSTSSTTYNMITADLDGDGNYEVVYSSGNQLFIKDSSLNTLASTIIDDANYVTAVPTPCDDPVYGTSGNITILIPRHIAGGSVSSYCFNGTALKNVDTGGVILRSLDDQLTCEYSAFTGSYVCFIADISGYSVCEVGTSAVSCINHTVNSISGHWHSLKPAVKNIDGSSDLEAVFYCNTSSTQTDFGFTIVDESGNTDLPCQTDLAAYSGAEEGDLQQPSILTENNYIIGHVMQSVYTNRGYNYYKAFDRFGTTKYDTTASSVYNDIYWGHISNIIERDTNDDGYKDQFCYAVSFFSTSYSYLDCYDTSSGVRDADHSDIGVCHGHYNRNIGELVGIEIDSSIQGEELLLDYSGENRWYYYSYNSSKASNDKFSCYGLNGTITSNHTIITSLRSTSDPDFLFYDGGGLQYWLYNETGYIPPTPPSPNEPPTFIDINITNSTGVTTTDNFFLFEASMNDTENDTLQWCVDCEWNQTHEATGDVSTSGYVLCTNQTNMLSCSEPNEIRGDRIKFYVYDGNNSGWGNFSDSLLYDWVSEGDYFDAQSAETNLVWSNSTPTEYLKIKVKEKDTYDYLNDMQVIISNFSRPAPDGEPRVWKITGERDDISDTGEAYFRLPNGKYLLKLVDVAAIPRYEDTWANCTTTTSYTTTCQIEMSPTGESNVTGEELHFTVRDSTTYTNLDGVNVTLISPEYYKKITNTAGIVNFYNLSYTTYEIEFEKEGYTHKQGYWLTSAVGYTISLIPESENPTTIDMTVKDQYQTPVKDVFVTMYNPSTFETYYAFTATDGTVWQQVYDGNMNWQITLEKSGYEDYSTTRFIESFKINTFTLYTQKISTAVTNGTGQYITDRGCQDTISGVWLCGVKFNTCDSNDDCISGMCDASGFCSSFNWTWCDANGRSRNQRCMFIASFQGFMNATADWMLDNFFWLLIIIVLLLLFLTFIVMIRSRIRH